MIMILLPLNSVQGSAYSWKVSDKYTWEIYSGFSSSYENSTATWDDYSFFLQHKVDVKILEVNTVGKNLLLEESWYHPSYEDYKKPFKIQEVDNSYDLISNLSNNDINSLFIFDYEFDALENESYLKDVSDCANEYRLPSRYFCSANWSVINSLFQALFNNTAIIDSVNGTEITFRDFLDNSNFTIMGESNYTTALNQMIPTNHHWSATFNYSNLLEVRGPEITSFEVEEANAIFDLQYSEGGVLEKYLVRNSIVIHINNYTYRQLDIRENTLINSNVFRNLLLIIIPTTIVGLLAIVSVVLVIKIVKRRKV